VQDITQGRCGSTEQNPGKKGVLRRKKRALRKIINFFSLKSLKKIRMERASYPLCLHLTKVVVKQINKIS